MITNFEEFWADITADIPPSEWTVEMIKIATEAAWTTGKLTERHRIIQLASREEQSP